MRLLKDRSLCLWIVCPETGGVRKFRLRTLPLALCAFALAFAMGAGFGLAFEFRELAHSHLALSDSYRNANEARRDLDAQNSVLQSEVLVMQQDKSRYEVFEHTLQTKLGALEQIVRETLALHGVEEAAAKPDAANAVGGAEIPCRENEEGSLRCKGNFTGGETNDADALLQKSSSAGGTRERLDADIALLRNFPLGSPLQSDESSAYGWRKSPFSKGISFHPGTDFFLTDDRRVHVTADGVVSKVSWDRTYGRMIDVDHGAGLITRYAHLSRALVAEGQQVNRGQEIGIGGSTGLSTGPHLHYEIRINRRARNPERFIALSDALDRALRGGES